MMEITSDGTKEWFVNGQRHREDGPAVEYKNGDEEWFKNGKRHREDGPAVINKYKKEWWLNNILQREDGPTVEYKNGIKLWSKNGMLHREDGPAIENINGNKSWYYKNKLHRIDGPALSNRLWFVSGVEYKYEKLRYYVKMLTRFLIMVKHKKIIKRACLSNIIKSYFCIDISCNIALWI